jgi:hypothetical protein
LDVHHLTYVRFGHERLEDLLTLCRPCHDAAHDRVPVSAPTGQGQGCLLAVLLSLCFIVILIVLAHFHRFDVLPPLK